MASAPAPILPGSTVTVADATSIYNGYTGFVWELSRQHDGCYMTDAVGAVPVAQLFPFMAPTAPLPPLGEVPLGPHAHPGWLARAQLWDV